MSLVDDVGGEAIIERYKAVEKDLKKQGVNLIDMGLTSRFYSELSHQSKSQQVSQPYPSPIRLVGL